MTRDFRVGEFDRDQVAAPLRAFCPTESAVRLEEIQLEGLHNRGKKLILLDVDNTLTHWRSEEIADEVRGWLQRARDLGFSLCILSNTRHPERLERLSKNLGVKALRGRMKPSRNMYLRALEEFGATQDEAIMVGDQLLTDVFGANRSGIESIWLQPLGTREFKGTKINRWIERRIVGALYNALVMPVDATPEAPELERKKPLWERTIVQQIVKFVIVGGSSFVIDTGLSVLFMNVIRLHGTLVSTSVGTWLRESIPWMADHYAAPDKAAAPFLFGLASFIAMFNSFVWNRQWTFEVRGKGQRMRQLRRFYAVSILGAILNALIAGVLFHPDPNHPNKSTIVAKFLAAIVVAVWNFLGQRLYAFRHD